MWNEQGRVFSYDEQYRSVTFTYCCSAAVVQYKYDTVQAVLYSVVLYNTTLQSTHKLHYCCKILVLYNTWYIHCCTVIHAVSVLHCRGVQLLYYCTVLL